MSAATGIHAPGLWRPLPYIYKNGRYYHNDVTGHREAREDAIAAKDHANALALEKEDRETRDGVVSYNEAVAKRVVSAPRWT